MKKMFILILLVIDLFGNTIEIAKDLFDNKAQYKEAIEIFEKFPNDAEAQYYLGKANLYGMGLDKNEKKAFEYAQKSANQNNSLGLNLLAVLYADGIGVNKDELQALMYYKQAANLGNTKAMRNIGSLYLESNVLNKNEETAEYWYLKAVEYGDIDGFINLADKYFNLKENEKALKYYLEYEKVYKGNKIEVLYSRIGFIYDFTLKDYVKAYDYILKASKLGNYDQTFKLFNMVDINLISKDKYNEAFSFLEKAIDRNINKTISIDTSIEIYSGIVLYEQENYEKWKKFATKEYEKYNNISIGCNLASLLGNISIPKFDLEKSFKISSKIIEEYGPRRETSNCYSSLALLFRQGNYTSKDLKKAIELHKELYNVVDIQVKEYDSKIIADIYLEELQDYDNARKWYKITYDLTKEDKYLTIVDEYQTQRKNDLEEGKRSTNEVFPILDDFSKKEQVNSALETNDYLFFTVASDKSIKMYDKKTLKFLKEFRSWISNGLEGMPLQMAFDENKKILYFSVLNSASDFSKNDLIHAVDINTKKIIRTINNKMALKNTSLDISNDGKYLVAINNNNLINIIDIDTGRRQFYNLDNKEVFLAANIIKEGNDYVINAVNRDKKLYKFSLNKSRRIGIEDFNNQTSFKFFNNQNALNIFKNNEQIKNINFINNNLEIQTNNSLKIFNLNNLTMNKIEKISDKKDITSFIELNIKYNGELLEIHNTKDNTKKEILFTKNALILNSLVIEDKYILVVTSDPFAMLLFNLNGEPLANLQGFNAIQKNVFYSNKYLFSYGDDNVLHAFYLDNLDNLKFDSENFDNEMLNGFAKNFGDTVSEIKEAFMNPDEDFIHFMKKSFKIEFELTKQQFISYAQLFLLQKEIINPLASLYIKNEKDWIIYTPEGLFTYGGEGKNLIKYHQNQGLYKEAKIVENDKLFDKFYRPDLIKKILAGEKVEIPMDVKSVILNILPPELRILENKMLNSKDIELIYQICDAGNGIADLKLLINGQAISPPTTRGFSIEKDNTEIEKCKIYKSILTLYPGKSTIELKAYDAEKYISNVSDELEISANYTMVEKSSNFTEKEIEKLGEYAIVDKANLYIVFLAVSEFEDKRLDLKYPVNDVIAVKESIKSKSKSSFENIYSYDLYNKEVSIENINKVFDEISKKIKYNDTFLLYVAGHGFAKDGKYQFIPYKINEKISIDDIKHNLSKIVTNKSLVLLDTCQSGAAIDNIVYETATVNRLSHDDNRNYIVASSKEQVALEGYNNHGIFTYSVLDAFINNENLKVLGLANYVSEMVPTITKEKFHFEQIPQVKLNQNFVLSGDN